MKKVSRKQAKELAALARMPDEKIDLTDAPEVREWRGGGGGEVLPSHQEAGDDPRGRRCAPTAASSRGWCWFSGPQYEEFPTLRPANCPGQISRAARRMGHRRERNRRRIPALK